MKHTPGPWEILQIERGWALNAIDGTGDIAHVYIKFNFAEFTAKHIDNGTGYANALLIRATPDMLKALELAKIALESLKCDFLENDPCFDYTKLWTPLDEKALQCVTDAIKKAEGRSI